MRENIPVWISIVDRLKGPRYLSRDVTILILGQGNKEQISVNTAL